jgi:hypothetical protein
LIKKRETLREEEQRRLHESWFEAHARLQKEREAFGAIFFASLPPGPRAARHMQKRKGKDDAFAYYIYHYIMTTNKVPVHMWSSHLW